MSRKWMGRLRAAVLTATATVAAAVAALAPLPPAAAQRAGGGYDGAAASRDQAGRRDVAGAFDYYVLVLSWSPTYCAGLPRGEKDPQCEVASSRPYAFVLHGLWPQYQRGYPERCYVPFKPYVPQATIDRMLDIMPSPKLVIHEYRKHGTCTGLTPDGYYDLSRKLFATIAIPERYVAPAAQQTVSPDDLIDEFIAKNPQLRPDMLVVACGGAGNRLREVRICFDKSGVPATCGANENQRRLCSASRMYVPPVRGSARPPAVTPEAGRTPAPAAPRSGGTAPAAQPARQGDWLPGPR
ncbi:MAG: ribonuclease T2 [Hyphomicrobiaceae bacterium]|nr:ribonuclease T2 [Hyphomicrobiaceae bacterium]